MFIAECDSTNNLLKAIEEKPKYVWTDFQTSGRGQAGNGWESERGKNLLCSVLLPPRKNLFELNVVTAVAVQRMLGDDFTVKWPNDIYWRDKKIAGILIENALIGNEVRYSIAGIGLNVNQTAWKSDAPNPVSLKQITGQTYDIEVLMQRLYAEIQKALHEELWDYYKAHLYRREGYWPFVEREVNTAPTMNASSQAPKQFRARIADVLPTGEIVLQDQQGKYRKYHFKQIQYVL